MDMFIDKFAQRRNAQDMIRANYMAEAEENDRLRSQVSGYEMLLQEVRKVNMQSMDNAEKTKSLMNDLAAKIAELQSKPQADYADDLKNLQKDLEQVKEALKQTQDSIAKLSEQDGSEGIAEKVQEALAGQKTTLEEMFKGAEDFNHKEAVKVYRNVQAVVEEELPKQTEAIREIVVESTKESKVPAALLPLCGLTLFAVWVNIAILVVHILGII